MQKPAAAPPHSRNHFRGQARTNSRPRLQRRLPTCHSTSTNIMDIQPVAISPKARCSFLGFTDVPQLGLGLAALGRPGYINLGHGGDLKGKSMDEMRSQCHEILSAARAMGLRYFDAARSYGSGEEFLGGWLDGLSPGAVEGLLVGSKWGYQYTAGWQIDTGGAPHEVKSHTLPTLTRQWRESEGLLGRHLRLYQVHSATLDSGVLEAADVLSELERLKADKGWKIGLSLSGVHQAATLTAARHLSTSDGSPLFDCVQATWNLLETSAGPALTAAAQAGMTVIVKEALANGRLTPRNTGPQYADRMEVLKQTADKYGTTIDALSLAAAMRQPFRPMVLSGATTIEQLAANAAALELVGRLQDSDLEALMTALPQAPEQYWGERAALAWN